MSLKPPTVVASPDREYIITEEEVLVDLTITDVVAHSLTQFSDDNSDEVP